jgi:hypothetical protein
VVAVEGGKRRSWPWRVGVTGSGGRSRQWWAESLVGFCGEREREREAAGLRVGVAVSRWAQAVVVSVERERERERERSCGLRGDESEENWGERKKVGGKEASCHFTEFLIFFFFFLTKLNLS